MVSQLFNNDVDETFSSLNPKLNLEKCRCSSMYCFFFKQIKHSIYYLTFYLFLYYTTEQ